LREPPSLDSHSCGVASAKRSIFSPQTEDNENCALAIFALALVAPRSFTHEFLYETTLNGLVESSANASIPV